MLPLDTVLQRGSRRNTVSASCISKIILIVSYRFAGITYNIKKFGVILMFTVNSDVKGKADTYTSDITFHLIYIFIQTKFICSISCFICCLETL